MPFYYLDSSVVVKRYVQEPGSAWTRQLIGDKANRIFLSAIALAEVSAAMAICVREGKLTQNLGTRAYLEFNKHIASAEYLLWPLPLTIMQKAAELAQSYPLKGYDAVQGCQRDPSGEGHPQERPARNFRQRRSPNASCRQS